MATALNFTVPLKQDPQSQESLGHLVTSFAQEVQPAIDAALARSQIVHFARIVVIDNQYLQVLTGAPSEAVACRRARPHRPAGRRRRPGTRSGCPPTCCRASPGPTRRRRCSRRTRSSGI